MVTSEKRKKKLWLTKNKIGTVLNYFKESLKRSEFLMKNMSKILFVTNSANR